MEFAFCLDATRRYQGLHYFSYFAEISHSCLFIFYPYTENGFHPLAHSDLSANFRFKTFLGKILLPSHQSDRGYHR